MRLPRRSSLRRSALATGSIVAVSALLLAGCGSKATESDSANATSCVDTSGPTIKVGSLNSLSGTMAISEVTVRDAIALAVEEINAAGGVMGKQIQVVGEDGASEPTVFAEKAEKLISSDCVAAVFGGWTSSSRKAMLPVFESANSLLYYPVQYEGLESSKNIFYTGATTNQQIVPALDYLKEKGVKSLYLVGSDYVFPQTANRIIKAYADANGIEIKGEDYTPLGSTDFSTIVNKVRTADADAVFNTLNGDSNVAFFREYTQRRTDAAGDARGVGVDRRGRGRRHRCAEHHRPADGLELLPDDRQPGERRIRQGLQGQVRRQQADIGSDGGRLRLGLPVEEHGREGEVVRRSRRAGSGRRRAVRRPGGPGARSTATTTTSPRPPGSARSVRTA